jgi:hypothetical protein
LSEASSSSSRWLRWMRSMPINISTFFLLAVDQRLFTADCNGLIAAVDSCPSQGDTWMLPVGGIIPRTLRKPAKSYRSLHQRLVNNTLPIHIKGNSNDSIVAQVFPRKSRSRASVVSARNLPPNSRVVSPGADFVGTILHARSEGVYRNIWWRPVL